MNSLFEFDLEMRSLHSPILGTLVIWSETIFQFRRQRHSRVGDV